MATAVRYNGPSTSATIRASDGLIYTCPSGSQITVPDDTAIALFAEGWTAPDGTTPGFTPPGPNVVEEVFLVNGTLSKHGGGGTYVTVPVGGGAPTVVSAGSLGATYTADMTGHQSLEVVGTLTTDLTITLTGGSAGAEVRFLLTQDVSGGHALALSDGTNTQTVSIPTAAASAVAVDVVTPDGTTFYVDVAGATAGSTTLAAADGGSASSTYGAAEFIDGGTA